MARQPRAPLSDAHRTYVARETAVAVGVNAVLSLGFALATAAGRPAVPLWGLDGMALDFVPQAFMVTFATTLAATLLARKRLRSGHVAPLERGAAGRLAAAPRSALVRAALFGAAAAVVVAPVCAGTLALLGIDNLPTPAFLGMKVAVGAALSCLIAPPIARAALAPDRPLAL